MGLLRGLPLTSQRVRAGCSSLGLTKTGGRRRPSRELSLTIRAPLGSHSIVRGRLLVSLFVGGPPNDRRRPSPRRGWLVHASSRTAPSMPITPRVPNGELDTCWLENNGRYAFGANYGSGTISSYSIGNDGSLKLLNAVAGTTDAPDPPRSQGSTPLDLGISDNGRFLYNVLPGSGKVAAWRIIADGSLEKIGEFAGLGQAVDGDHADKDFGPGESPAGIAVY